MSGQPHVPRAGRAGRRVLFVKLAALGDVALASAYADAFRRRHPDGHLTWLCGRSVAPLVRRFPGVDAVIEADERALLRGGAFARARALSGAWRAVGLRAFDEIALGHADGRYALLAAPARGPRRALSRRPGDRDARVPGRWFADDYARLALPGGPCAVERAWDIADLRGRVGDGAAVLAARDAPSDGRPLVALVPGGARNALRDTPQRRWPVARYADLAARLLARGDAVALLGDAGDAWVRDAFAGLPVLDLVGRTSLVETLAVLETATAVVSHDTGPMHLARLVRAPLVALFGPTAPGDFVGEAPEVRVLWGGARLACRPCYDGREVAPCANNLCMQDIGVGAVDDALRELRGAARPVPGAWPAPAALAVGTVPR